MPVRNYFLDSKNKDRLELSWKRNYRKCNIRYNGNEVISIDSKKEFLEGKECLLDYKSVLKVQLRKSMIFFKEIDLTVDEKPVPGSMTDPFKQIKNIYELIFFIASVNLFFGAVSLIFDPPLLQKLGVGWFTLAYGVMFLLLGVMVKRFSQTAMILAIVLMVFDIISIIMMSTEGSTVTNPTGDISAKVIFLIFMLRGIPVINRKKLLDKLEEKRQKEREEKKKVIPKSKQITQDHTRFMPSDHSRYFPDAK